MNLDTHPTIIAYKEEKEARRVSENETISMWRTLPWDHRRNAIVAWPFVRRGRNPSENTLKIVKHISIEP